MPIPKSAVDGYLARQLETLTWLKDLTPLQVEEELGYIKPKPQFHCPLRTDQKILFLLGIAYPGVIFMTDLGSGKTAVSLELLSYYYQHGFLRRGFVFCPTDEVAEGWEDEVKKWNFSLPFVRLKGSSKNKWEQLQEFDKGLVIGTYMGISAMVAALVPMKDKNGKELDKRQRQIVPRRILAAIDKVDAMVLDQCFLAGTLVTTSNGNVPIELIRKGDKVLSSDFSYRPVKSVFQKKSSFITHLYLSNGAVIYTTPDHPFFTDLGWVCAGNLEGRYLYAPDDLRDLWKSVPCKAIENSKNNSSGEKDTILQCILLEELEEFQRDAVSKDVSASCKKSKLEQGQPLERRIKEKIERTLFEKWPHLKNSWRERHAYATTAATFTDYIKPALDIRVQHFIKAEAARLSNLLYSRFCSSSQEDNYRGRWPFSHKSQTKSDRHKENCQTGRIRVDCVKNIQLDSPQNVYTITLGGCPHFFAEGVLVHNSTKVSNSQSLSFEVCKQFAVEAQIKFGLAGRAFGREPFALWAQFFLVDDGHALGRSPGMFREAFWRRVRSPWGISWTIRKRREPALSKMIAASSLRYSIEECVDLPPKVYIQKECEFPQENWVYYDQVREELIAAKGNYQEVQNNFLRMRQISSGFVGFTDDETGERAQIEFEVNPKLDLLIELISEVPEDRKLVVFYEHTWFGSRICQELTKLKLKHGWLWSGTKEWTKIKDAFNNDPEFRIIVANWKKGAMGLNLQAASYMFFAESPVSSIERYECEGRIFRVGQKYKSMIYDVMMKDSVDQRILELHQEGASTFKALVEDPAKYFGR